MMMSSSFSAISYPWRDGRSAAGAGRSGCGAAAPGWRLRRSAPASRPPAPPRRPDRLRLGRRGLPRAASERALVLLRPALEAALRLLVDPCGHLAAEPGFQHLRRQWQRLAE